MNYQYLKKEVELWVKDGLVGETQASKILARYSAEVPVYARMSFWLKCLAGVLVGFALLLVISENWQRMGWLVQSALCLIPLLASHAAALWYERRDNALGAEMAWFFASIALGLNIMLQAQIFHISAYYPNGILLWVFGILPAMLWRSSAVHFILAAVLFCVYLILQIEYAQFSLVSLVPLAAIAYFVWLRQKAYTLLLLFAVLYLTFTAVLDKWSASQSGVAWFYAMLFFGVALLQKATRLEEKWLSRFLWSFFIIAAFLNILLTFRFFAHYAVMPSNATPTAILIFGSILAFFFTRNSLRLYRLTAFVGLNVLAMLTAIAIHSFFPEHSEAEDHPHYFLRTMANAVYLGSTVLILFDAIRQRTKIQFLSAVTLLLVWVLIRYLDLFKNYLVTALIFALAATAIVVLNKLWEKRYEK